MPPDQQEESAKPEAFSEGATRLLALTADVGRALTERGPQEEMLCGCAEAMVSHLGVELAGLWTLDGAAVLERRAVAGLDTPADDPHQRVPLGQFAVGRIAQERRPLLTNAVLGDPAAADQAWAAREGIVALAGCPLVVDGRLVGVAALFARWPLSPAILQALCAVAGQVAVGIDRKRAEEALQASESRYRAAIAHAAVGVTLADLQDRCLETNAAFCAITGHSEEELLHTDFPSLTHPDDRAESRTMMARLRDGEIASFVMEKRYVRKDGGIVWAQNSVALVRDTQGRPAGTIALTEDITERKEAAAHQRAFLRDVLASVTEGRLRLCQEAGELPAPLTPVADPIALSRVGGLPELRHAAQEAARTAGHPEDRVGDLAIAASEAGMNAIVHSGAGSGEVRAGGDGTVQVWVVDHGGGITLENLPNATLRKGYSSAGTLGQGMKMMLQTVDRVYLLTGPTGTTVVLEQEREPPLPAW